MDKTRINLILILAFVVLGWGLTACNTTRKKPSSAQSKVSFYELSAVSLFGDEMDFREFKGRKILVVNVASKCGFTPQYAQLQELYETFGEKLSVIGFPANNFMNQEPGTNEEIAQFCDANFGVTFPMSERISVRGSDIHPVYQWLTDPAQNGWNSKEPSWNFYKYLIDEKGELLAVFPSRTSPDDPEIVSMITGE